MPLSQFAGDLESGKLVRMLSEWSGQKRDVYLIWPCWIVLSVRARVFMAMLEDFLGTQSWFERYL